MAYTRRTSRTSNKEKNDELRQICDDERALLFTNEAQLREYLQFASKFVTYSVNNTLLIKHQNKNASKVLSFKKWQELGRNVKKGEHGIFIWCPAIYKTEKLVDVIDSNGKKVLDASGNVKKEKKLVKDTYFTRGAVFDVSQTEGDPLPDMENKDTEDPIYETEEDLYDALHGISDTVSLSTNEEMLNEYVSSFTKDMKFSSNSEQLAAVKAAAITTAAYLQMDTVDFDLSDITIFGKGKEQKELEKFLSTVKSLSKAAITALD